MICCVPSVCVCISIPSANAGFGLEYDVQTPGILSDLQGQMLQTPDSTLSTRFSTPSALTDLTLRDGSSLFFNPTQVSAGKLITTYHQTELSSTSTATIFTTV